VRDTLEVLLRLRSEGLLARFAIGRMRERTAILKAVRDGYRDRLRRR
jgi:hypothetical protein